MTIEPGPLVAADELLTHQIVDTFATVGQADPSWTEKIWATAHARDGSLQVVFGIGKYTNRGVFDGAGGVSRGTEQWTVRGSRRLGLDPNGGTRGDSETPIVLLALLDSAIAINPWVSRGVCVHTTPEQVHFWSHPIQRARSARR